MKLLPESFPLDQFHGCLVATVAEVPHQVEIRLLSSAGAARIEFEGPALLEPPNQQTFKIDNATLVEGAANFQCLVGAFITLVARVSPGGCKFSFSNGYALSLFANPEGFESYHLGVAGDFCDV